MSTPGSCNASKSNDDDVCEMVGKLEKMRTAEDNEEEEEDVSICANCGKEGANNICNKCKMVTYCNAACKKKHRHKHKKDCEEHLRLATEKHNEELRIAAEFHDIELFKQPPPEYGDCPICFLLLPTLTSGWRYMVCCGKVICSGCCYAPVYDNQGNEVDIIKQNKCPFCRTVAPKLDKEMNSMLSKRSEAGDAVAIFNQGNHYRDGVCGCTQDYKKGVELWHRAAELGFVTAYGNIGSAYYLGKGVGVDKKKSQHYYEVAAIGGDVQARSNLGINERLAGNMDRALKHYMIAAKSGHSKSMEVIKEFYTFGYATKEEYMKALQSYQRYLGEIKSHQRDEAAAFSDEYRYY